MSKGLLRRICAMLVVLLLVSSGSSGLAAAWDKDGNTKKGLHGTQAYVYTYVLKVYKEPSTSSEVVAQVPFAKKILLVETRKGWAKVVTTNNEVGFCNAKQLITANPNTMDTVVYGQETGTNVYLRPSISSPRIAYLDRNETCTLVAMTPKADWLRVEQGGYYGYVMKQQVDYDRYYEGESAWITASSVDVYYHPSVKSVMGTLYYGQSVSLVSVNGTWAKIRGRKSIVGYCDVSAVTTANPNTYSQTVYTQVDGNYLFTSSTDLSGRRAIDANAEMTLVAVDSNQFWARVLYNGGYYYVPYLFLDTEKRQGDYKKVITRQGVNIRAGTKKSSDIVYTVPTGTTLYLVGALDNRARVATLPDGSGHQYIGYVEVGYLR